MMPSTYWFVFQNDRLLIAKHKLLCDVSIFSTALTRQYLLAALEVTTIYCAELDPAFALSTEFETISLRKALELLGPDWYTMAVKAYSIIQWDKNHYFCGRCGNQTVYKAGTFERVCTVCTLTFYPRISPSIIVLIHKGDFILMARGYHFPPGAYGLIAGFVEAGESVEEAVHREVKEEVSVKIKNLHYFGSQAWPFPDSLMIAFTADYVEGEIVRNDEIEAADWYHYDNLPGRPSFSLSIAQKLIDHFIEERKKEKRNGS